MAPPPAQRKRRGRGRVVMLVDNKVEGDSRVQKQARSMAERGWDVVLLGKSPDNKEHRWRLGDARVRLVPVPMTLAKRRYEFRRAPLRSPLAYPPGRMSKYAKQKALARRAEVHTERLALADRVANGSALDRPAAAGQGARQPGAGEGAGRPGRAAHRPHRGARRAPGPDGLAAGPVHHVVLAEDDGQARVAPARPEPVGLGAGDGAGDRRAEARPDPRQRLPHARRGRPRQDAGPRRGPADGAGVGRPRLPARHQPVEQPPPVAQGDDRARA